MKTVNPSVEFFVGIISLMTISMLLAFAIGVQTAHAESSDPKIDDSIVIVKPGVAKPPIQFIWPIPGMPIIPPAKGKGGKWIPPERVMPPADR